jgi:hypothetical protein
VCISFWSAAFVFDSVLAIERAVYCRSGWGVFSSVGVLSLCHFVLGNSEACAISVPVLVQMVTT